MGIGGCVCERVSEFKYIHVHMYMHAHVQCTCGVIVLCECNVRLLVHVHVCDSMGCGVSIRNTVIMLALTHMQFRAARSL